MMPSVRRAALALHSLIEADKTWILSRLPVDQRKAIGPLLSELNKLGFPADPAVIRAALREDQVGRISDSDPRIKALWRCESARLLLLLRAEPDDLVARILLLREWPWKREVLDGLGGPRAKVVLAAMESVGAMPPKLFEALLDRFHERMSSDMWSGSRATNTARPGMRFIRRRGQS